MSQFGIIAARPHNYYYIIMKNPQSKAHKLSINEAQLAFIIDAMERSTHVNIEFDETDVFWVSPEQTLSMLIEIQNGDDAPGTLHGLCL